MAEFAPLQLLDATLTEDQLMSGWIRLFDGSTSMGWFVEGNANWSIGDGIVRVDSGDPSFLCTRLQFSDFELQVDFRCDPQTNSGIFLRTTPRPGDVATQCLELNIAPPDNPFPTGSFVRRQRLDPQNLGPFDPTQWHTYRVRVAGRRATVQLDGREVMVLEEFDAAPSGHIALQHNSGKVEFRNILLRPIGLTALRTDEQWESDWTASTKPGNSMEVMGGPTGLHLVGGLGQVQSKQSFGDFVLQTAYTLARPEVNSCLLYTSPSPRDVEESRTPSNSSAASDVYKRQDPLRPADGGAGAIFRRQNARIVVGDGTRRTFLTLYAVGPYIATWVNGLQVVDFIDRRPPDDNPRRGLRLAPGPLALQGHDPTTDVVFHAIAVSRP